MTEGDAGARRPVQALLAAALLAVTALVRVPTQLYDASRQDFAGPSGAVLLLLFGSGLVVALLLAAIVTWLPPRPGTLAGTVLVGISVYAWVRASFYPGPSVNLDGRRLSADLSTGVAGVLVPLAAALLLAWLGRRQPRIVATLLAVLLAGSLVQSFAAAASAWRPGSGVSERSASSLLEWSREGNVLVLIMDTLQADVFADVLETEPRLREDLDGFRWYRAASSSSPTTYLSLPAIHSGRRYDPTGSAREFFFDSISQGSVLNRLVDAGHRVSYAMNLQPCPAAVTNCLSMPVLGRSPGEVAIREALYLLDLGLYRVGPDGLRRAILGRGKGLLGAVAGKAFLVDRAEGELAALRRFVSASTVSDSPPTVKMIHTMITHPPLVLRPDCSTAERRLDRGGAIDQVRCALGLVVGLLERLKAEGIYDSSDIVIVADHGYGIASKTVLGTRDAKFRRMLGALNPTVLVKPARERGSLAVSDAPIELADLARALCGPAACSPSEGLHELANVDPGRDRQAFWYSWKHRYWKLPQIPGIVEYTIRGDLRRTESWSRKPTAYTPGTLLDFRRGQQNSSPYLGFGWGLRRPTFQEMVDSRATLFLRASFDPGRDYEMVLHAQVYAASPTEPSSVEVLVDGHTVGELVSGPPGSAPREYRLRIPAAALQGSPDTTITFSTVKPDRGPAPREALALQTLVVRPLPGTGRP